MTAWRIALALIGLSALTRSVFAAGDADVGRSLYQRHCQSCHSLDDNEMGPRHRGVFNRRAGTVPDYAYSAPVKTSGIVWTARNLDRWLTDPESLIPGQQMNFRVPNAHERRDLIAYLRRVSDPSIQNLTPRDLP
jgi:cytochrome c